MRVRNVVFLSLISTGCALDSGDGSNRGGTGGTSIGGTGGIGGVAGTAGSGGGGGVGGFSGAGGLGGGTVDAGGDAGGDVCTLRFDSGPCNAAFAVWAFVPELGACFPHLYGGCGGNGNNFNSRMECEAACPTPDPQLCPPNRASQEICLACGPAGGCAESVVTCALICADPNGCASSVNVACVDGVCQLGPCF